MVKFLQIAGFEKFLVQRLEDLCRVKGIVIVKIVNPYPNRIGKEENISEVHEKAAVNLRCPQQCQYHKRDGVYHTMAPSSFNWRSDYPSDSSQENHGRYGKKITCRPKGKAMVIQHHQRTKPEQRKKDQNISVSGENPIPYPGCCEREQG
jgi:hypothetical protein